jgi:hypothetical protein
MTGVKYIVFQTKLDIIVKDNATEQMVWMWKDKNPRSPFITTQQEKRSR